MHITPFTPFPIPSSPTPLIPHPPHPPPPHPTAIPAHIKAKGWSDAKAHAATQLLKNPNQYFYRLTAPGSPQAHGDWSEEEHTLFVKTMRQHGVGDKWYVYVLGDKWYMLSMRGGGCGKWLWYMGNGCG